VAAPVDERCRSSSRPNTGKSGKNKKKSPMQDDPRAVGIRETLGRYLTDMKKDHVYIAKNVLAAARLDVDSRTPYMGNGKGGRPGIIYDDVSPFKKMKSIQVLESEAPRNIDGIRLKVKHITKPNTSTVREIFVPTVLSKVTPGVLVPRKCRHFTTLRNNILGENEEEMRYLPYFGEGAEEDVLEGLDLSDWFTDKTKSSVEDGKTMECKLPSPYELNTVLTRLDASFYISFMKNFLEEVDVSLDAVILYLIGDISQMYADQNSALARRKSTLPKDFDLTDPKVKTAQKKATSVELSELYAAETVCRVFKEMTGISVWEVAKKLSSVVKDSLSPTKQMTTGASAVLNETGDKEVALLTGGNPWPYSLDSYASLCCVVCYM
jgi:hypothetical protein